MSFDLLSIFADIGKKFPGIKTPSVQLSFKQKMYYTVAVLFIYFALFSIDVIGVKAPSGNLDFLQIITASRIGSFLTLGIGPIVLASIFLQLLKGAGVINVDLKNPAERTKFHEAQRTLMVLIALFEGIIFSTTMLAPHLISIAGIPTSSFVFLVMFQLILGAIIVMYLDELLTKYGIGSGISLFIAAGVSMAIVGGIINVIFGEKGIIAIFAQGEAIAIKDAFIVALPLFFTIAIFLIVAFFEGTKVKLPLQVSFMGHNRPLELPLFYVSNIPVIFAAALLLNLELLAVPISSLEFNVGGTNVFHYIAHAQDNRLVDGLFYLFSPIRPGYDFISYLNILANGTTPFLGIPEWVHAITYIIFLSLVAILFGLFWVETSNMDAKSVAQQLSSHGAGLKGFRVDRRLLESRLEEYILPLTVLGSFLVGLLAGIADLTGAFGTGTGILLTVGILYRFYGQIKEGIELYFPTVSMFLFGRN